MLYNSTTGNYTGFTEYGIQVAHHFQENPFEKIKRKVDQDLLCNNYLDTFKDLSKWFSHVKMSKMAEKFVIVLHRLLHICKT